MKKSWINKGEKLLNEIEHTTLSADETALWYIGQSGFVFKHAHTIISVDPVLNDLKDEYGNTRRYYEPPFEAEQFHVDLALCTHAHRDHYDKPTIKQLVEKNPQISIIVPKGIVPLLLEDGIPADRIIGMNDQESIKIKGTRISAFALAHPVIEKDEQGDDLNLGYEIEQDELRIVHLGDTYLCDELLDQLCSIKGMDVLIGPINGQDHFRTSRGCIGNLSAYEAVMTAKTVNARLVIPCHYDMVMGNTCSVLGFVAEMEEHYPEGCFALPRLGERMILKKETK